MTRVSATIKTQKIMFFAAEFKSLSPLPFPAPFD
jgi:hypothetical protein